jgi:hypothetical protein
MLRKTVKLLTGVLCLPLCIGFTWQFAENAFTTSFKADVPYYFVAGGIAYLVLHLLFKQPILTYVFGHELTHALFALVFGGAVKSFRATERGGQVTVTKSNFLITLAPYFFPLYTFMALLLYFLSNGSEIRGASSFFVFLTGATFTFHILLTFIFLRAEQKDIREEGAFFSYPLIFLFNIIFAALLLHLLLARKNGFLDFLEHGIIKSLSLIVRLFF